MLWVAYLYRRVLRGASIFLANSDGKWYHGGEVREMSFDFVQNRSCEYFPCHTGADPEAFNCLFCYCPLYALGDRCGGNFSYTKDGVKDCSNCLRPHRRECYGDICEKLQEIMELAKRPPIK